MNNWRVVPLKEYNLRERTSLSRFNSNLILIENKKTKERKWVYKQVFKGDGNDDRKSY